MKYNIIASDPGSPIAYAAIRKDGRLAAVARDHRVAVKRSKTKWENSPMLSANLIEDWIDKLNGPVIFISEHTYKKGGNDIVGMDAYLGSLWMFRGIAAGLGYPVELVSSAKWKADLGLRGGPENKDMSRAKAAEIWPEAAKKFARSGAHDIAEAALIGYWKYKNLISRG